MAESPNPIDEALGARVRYKRVALGWSITELAEMLGASPADVGAYESGATRISAERLLLLAQAFGVRPSYSFGVDPGARPAPSPALPEQGLRLHRAFASVSDPAVREAIVALVAEIAKRGGSD